VDEPIRASKDNPFRPVTEIDESVPSVARVYDYALGGSHNFAVDRALAERVFKVVPGYRDFAHANRSFLRRSVLWLREHGIHQFIDLGSGIPTVGNVHEIAPDAKIVYVDRDLIAVTHSHMILRGHDNAIVLQAEASDIDGILGHEDVRNLLDLSQPVGLLTVAVLHFMSDEDDPAGVLAGYHDALAPGSMLAMSHASGDDLKPDMTAAAVSEFKLGSVSVTPRSADEVEGLLGPWRAVEPGLVRLDEWHPEVEPPAQRKSSHGYAVVAESTR
jgi:hypothetical protein